QGVRFPGSQRLQQHHLLRESAEYRADARYRPVVDAELNLLRGRFRAMRLSHACLMILAPVLMAFGALASAQAQCALPYTLANGQPPDATKLMANFNALIGCINVGGANNSIQYNSGSGSLGGVGPLANGQVMIGSTGNPPQAQTLTA